MPTSQCSEVPYYIFFAHQWHPNFKIIILNVDDPAFPKGERSEFRSITNFKIKGIKLYGTYWTSYLGIVEISDPVQWKPAGHFGLSQGLALDLELANGLIYMADTAGFYILRDPYPDTQSSTYDWWLYQ